AFWSEAAKKSAFYAPRRSMKSSSRAAARRSVKSFSQSIKAPPSGKKRTGSLLQRRRPYFYAKKPKNLDHTRLSGSFCIPRGPSGSAHGYTKKAADI
ncbi:MAG TPA: hypothetical protein PKI76_01665, partial [Oscillospiraceae bacterium]|nr:hypothetical protein [Oscillospiraceae bacterium]